MTKMKITRTLVAVAALLWVVAPATAQQERQPGPTTERDVLPLGQQTIPEPRNREIHVPFGESTRVYFKMPIKSIRIGDPNVIRAVPQSDHLVTFTGVSPGTSTIVLEASDGSTSNWGTATVIREVHEVKTYKWTAKKDEKGRNANVVIINESADAAKKSDEAEYSSSLCNEVSCRPLPIVK